MSNDNLNVSAESLMGGSTRVQFSRSNGDVSAQSSHNARMAEASERVSLLDAKTTRMSVTTGIGEAASSSGVITNAISTQGMPRAGSAITEESVIQIEGMPIKIGDAIKYGLAVRNANGTFSLVGASQPGKR